MTSRLVRYAPPVSGFAAIHPRAWGAEFSIEVGASAEPPALFDTVGNLAVVSIRNPLYQHDCFPFDNYDSILSRARAAFESEAESVVLWIDSPGGDFAGSIETARALRALAEASKKKLVAWTDSKALSAAYALACSADTICAAPSAFVANVGVWAPLFDVTRQDAAMGHRYVFAATGTRKLDHNPHVPITDSAYEALQSQVDEMGEMFFAHVAERRKLSVAAVKAIQGAEVLATRAQGLGLVDDLYDSFADLTKTASAGKLKEQAKGSVSTSLGKAMAKKSFGDAMKEALASVRSAYDESEGEEREKAKKAMRKMEALFEDDKKDDKEEGEAKARAEAEEKEKKDKEEADAKARAKAEADDKEKKEADAKALAASTLEMAKELQAMKAREAARDAADRKARAFASRPDFSKEIRDFLDKQPIETIEDACKTFPRVTGNALAGANSLVPNATVGSENPSTLPKAEADTIRAQMFGAAPQSGVRTQGRSLELGYLSPDQAAEVAKKYAPGKVA